MSAGETSQPAPKTILAWLLDLRRGAWVPIGVSVVLTLLMLAFGRTSSLDRVAVMFLTNTIVSFLIATSVTFGLGVVLPRVRRPDAPRALRLAIEGVTIAAATVVGNEIAVHVIAVAVPSARFARVEALEVALPVTFTATIVTVAIGRAREQRAAATARRDVAERELLRAELAALRARVQPHFLFNSLNTVAALIEEDPRAAEQAVLELAALFRYTLEGSHEASVTFAAELEAVRRYLRFEQLRFEERLRIEIAVEEQAEAVRVPPLFLQPLVENAVAHGVGTRKEGGRVAIAARITGDRLEVAVDDDGPGPRGSSHAGTGTATRDLDRRLALSYAGRAEIVTGTSRLGGYSVRLLLPLAGPHDAPASAPTEPAP